MKKKDITQHFSKEEKEFVEKIYDLCEQVETSYSPRLTFFLNPRQHQIAQSIASYFQLKTYSSLALVQTEMARMVIAPEYYMEDPSDLDILALEIIYSRKFHSLTHSQVLGTLLSQLGIKREFIGDIWVNENQAIVMVDRKFGPSIQNSVAKIARVPVSWKEQDWTRLELKTESKSLEKDILVSSLRLDKLVSVAFHLSRSVAVKLIESGQVKVDYVPMEQVGRQLEVGQMISVRKHGRVTIKEFLGYSKQGKLKLKIDYTKT